MFRSDDYAEQFAEITGDVEPTFLEVEATQAFEALTTRNLELIDTFRPDTGVNKRRSLEITVAGCEFPADDPLTKTLQESMLTALGIPIKPEFTVAKDRKTVGDEFIRIVRLKKTSGDEVDAEVNYDLKTGSISFVKLLSFEAASKVRRELAYANYDLQLDNRISKKFGGGLAPADIDPDKLLNYRDKLAMLRELREIRRIDEVKIDKKTIKMLRRTFVARALPIMKNQNLVSALEAKERYAHFLQKSLDPTLLGFDTCMDILAVERQKRVSGLERQLRWHNRRRKIEKFSAGLAVAAAGMYIGAEAAAQTGDMNVFYVSEIASIAGVAYYIDRFFKPKHPHLTFKNLKKPLSTFEAVEQELDIAAGISPIEK